MNNGDTKPASFSGRMIFMIVIAVLSTLLLIGQLWLLQVRKGSEYVSAIRKQSIRSLRIPPSRGRIKDRNGIVVADTVPVYNIIIFVADFKARGRLNSQEQTALITAERLEELDKITGLKTPLSERQILRAIKNDTSEKVLVYSNITARARRDLKNNTNLEEHFVFKENLSSSSLYLDIKKLPLLPAISRSERTAQAIYRQALRINKILKHEKIISLEKIRIHLRRYPALELELFSDISKEDLAKASELISQMRAVRIMVSTRRSYPQGDLAPHLLGSLGWKAPEKEYNYNDYSYFRPEMTGLSGIENRYNKQLRGTGGKKLVQVSIDGYVYKKGLDEKVAEDLKQFEEASQNGHDISLTIDAKAQKIANELMHGKKGAVVVLDCNSGAVLTMVSSPNYDLNKVMAEKRQFKSDYIQSLQKNNPDLPYIKQNLPLRNRALYASYMPGSIIKPLIALAGLQFNQWPEDEEFDCTGAFRLGKKARLRCHKRAGHGVLNLSKAIETSCNPFFCNLGTMTTLENILKVYKPAGIGSYPMASDSKSRFSQEAKGHLPGSKITRKRPWNSSETAYISIGQGRVNLSPLQAAIYTAAIATNGKVMRPYLVESIRDSKTGQFIQKHEPEQKATIPVDKKYFDIVKNAMRQVVIGENASAPKAEPKVFPVAGKTGTAQAPYYETLKNADGTPQKDSKGKIRKKRHIQKNTWFSCFGPYNNPKYAIVVLVEDGKSGGSSAAPIARELLDRWLSAE